MVDVIDPPLMRIGQRLYRKNLSRESTQTVPVGYLEEDEFIPLDDGHDNRDITNEPSRCVECKTVYIVGAIDARGDSFHANLYVPPMFYGSVIGQRGFIKQELEQKFVCKLKIPQHGVSSSYIEISAKCERQILAVADRIECIVSDARRKSRPNYFVCLPCTTPHILKSYAKFKEDVLAKAEADTTDAYFGVDEDLFIKETKLHLTLAVLLLVDQREVALASQLLADFGKQKIVNEKPFKLSIRGLNCMNDEPKSAYVLYATVSSNRTQHLCGNLFFNRMHFLFILSPARRGCRKKTFADLSRQPVRLLHQTWTVA